MYRKQTHAFTFHPNQKKCNPNKKKYYVIIQANLETLKRGIFN